MAVSKNNISDKAPAIFKIALLIAGLLILKRMLELFGILKSKDDRDLENAIKKAFGSSAFAGDITTIFKAMASDPKFKGLTPDQIFSSQINADKLRNVIVNIYSAGAGAGTNVPVILTQLRRLSNKLELAFANQLFISMYNVSLIDFIDDEVNETDMGKVATIINSLPGYTRLR